MGLNNGNILYKNIGVKNLSTSTCLTLSNTKRGTDLGTLVVPFDQTFHPLYIRKCVDFFFKLNLLPSYLLRSQGIKYLFDVIESALLQALKLPWQGWTLKNTSINCNGQQFMNVRGYILVFDDY